MWDSLIKLFHELSETSKLVIFLVLVAALIGYTVWQILYWRKQRDLKKQRGARWFGAIADELERRIRQ
jgi:hypothetical protein